MIIPINLEMLISHRLSADEYICCYLVYVKDFPYMHRYLTEHEGGHFPEHMVRKLVQRGYLIDGNSPHDPRKYVDQYIVTDKFTQGVLIDTDIAAEQLWNAYPKIVHFSDGSKTFPGRNVSPEVLAVMYRQVIKSDLRKHNRIMEALAWAVENNQIHSGIKSWVATRQWETIEEMKAKLDLEAGAYGEKEL